MSPVSRQIGFSSQKIRYEWLVKVSNLQLAGLAQNDIKAEILEYLAPWLPESGSASRSSRDKAATILMRTWVQPDAHLSCMRDDGLKLLNIINANLQRSVHWGMIMACYSFWGAVADAVGRLLKLQNVIQTAQIQRRIKETYGAGEVVARATRNVVNSFVDWGALQAGEVKGSYSKPEGTIVADVALTAWLSESVLRSLQRTAGSPQELLGSPRLFPFVLHATRSETLVANSSRLDLLQQGRDDTLIMLKQS